MATVTASALKARLGELLEIKKKEVDDVLWALQEVCTEAVKQGNTLTLPGVVKISCQVRPARKARNPRTGESVNVPAKVAVKAGLVSSLKQAAPALKSKTGKALLEEAETKQAERDKRRRKREKAEAAKSGTKTKKKSSKSSVVKTKNKAKTSKKKKLARY